MIIMFQFDGRLVQLKILQDHKLEVEVNYAKTILLISTMTLSSAYLMI